MNQKVKLTEFVSSAEALKAARAEPIYQEPTPTRSMDFIKSLILGIPIQVMVENMEQPDVEIEEDMIDLRRLAGLKNV